MRYLPISSLVVDAAIVRSGMSAPDPRDDEHRAAAGVGLTGLSLMLSGMVVYGGIGWALDKFVLHRTLLLPIGLVVGIGLGIYMLYVRLVRMK